MKQNDYLPNKHSKFRLRTETTRKTTTLSINEDVVPIHGRTLMKIYGIITNGTLFRPTE